MTADQQLLMECLPILNSFIRSNPTRTNGLGDMQDPLGAHGLLKRIDAHLSETTNAPLPDTPTEKS